MNGAIPRKFSQDDSGTFLSQFMLELRAYPKTDRNHQPKRASVRFDRINRGLVPYG